jgi:hypothetical protein
MEQTMRNGGLDLLLVLTVVLAVGVVVQDYRFDSAIARERAGAAAIDRELGALDVAVAEITAAAASAFAAPQAGHGWARQVPDLAATIESRIADLRSGAADAEVRARYDASVAALADILTIDRRAREALASRNLSLAAGLVRVDIRDAAGRLSGELAAARAVEDTAAGDRLTRLARLRFGMNVIALGWVLIVAMYAARLARRPAASPAATMAQMIRELPPPVKAPVPVHPATPPPLPAAPPVPTLHLGAAADLCVDLARLIDGRDLPGLVERAVKVLQARGVIIWTADPVQRILRPWLAHGYPEKVLVRLGSLSMEDDNVTSLAYRSACPQAMDGNGQNTAGAIAVPLMTSAGCTGVLAVELREPKATPDLTALATILGAQFAALIGPADQATQAAEA